METFYPLFNRLPQGEKYLILKKKYRQLLHERDAKHHGTDGDTGAHVSPAKSTATWDMRDDPPPQGTQQHEEQMSFAEPENAAEVNLKSAHLSLSVCGRRRGMSWDDSAVVIAAITPWCSADSSCEW